MDGIAQDLVLGSVILLLPLIGLAWLIWHRRPADQPEPEPDSELKTIVVEYPKLPHPDEQRFDEVPDRPAWMRQRNPERLKRWAAQKRGEVWSDDRG